MRTVTIVGASLSGLYAARELRAQGYDGCLVIVGDEPHHPYDRPPLSKDFLTGRADETQLALTDTEETTELGAEWILGIRARALDARGRTVLLDDGRTVSTDGVVIATGASARRLPGDTLAGVHTLRTLDDARSLREQLTRGRCRVVVIGGGFIGAETASSCSSLGHSVTVVEAAPLPLVPQLGAEMAAVCAALHHRGGVDLVTGTGVTGLRGTTTVTGVDLTDGRTLPADIVIVGIGTTPNTAWLVGSALALHDGVLCDDGCATALPQVVAVGDVAFVGGTRAEHWTSATQQPRAAVTNLLAGRTVETATAVPYFWSDQYGARIQFAGRRTDGDTVRITEGELSDGAPAEGGFLARYERDGRMTAVLAVDRPRPFMRARRELARGAGEERVQSAPR
ncbi:pyridine nucleotide-disulfide oxidoreductase [Streptomyces violarus]|uniref:NADPH-dependent 2,4-dienoyl-CoA reductase/sulfur reductase-like enzyme n=1 Tax=Streptomyces violarus TaxID=67380 RepID=A0A7W5F498_9ACTN|nr:MULTISPECIES: FAD-dependent oxidoreductase [Streptomyces]MBB3079562.1 NADPH-dependent 2,4-dienoyl-CoA reductase/sulfur reductase-like enzyme [Streptomyces violarus]WRU02585.1 FAD-dependent oxidoreductase [Streptomyces sp. CGMCC 4.1772]GHD25165.1 pyridine nucleotide-disulfide oxidoreductase [Streptomyces violarus]